ncbi:hypothetical protein TNIN_439181 [Trichonephila inaurata madagascariensis]|uniref:Uncharacterized protein n=1 Tax=Trichonephila inaurata madagascariensis TaxID=2747483 RepID=A0A8X7CH54_9ARAC|nr:hypothetical protein TNIN_439181 [Trichonephila inaurata madagascariensis]
MVLGGVFFVRSFKAFYAEDKIVECKLLYVEVCESYFADDAIRRNAEASDEKTEEEICEPLKRFSLRNFVLPIFRKFPKIYLKFSRMS